jgi:hypothetical protein
LDVGGPGRKVGRRRTLRPRPESNMGHKLAPWAEKK